MKKNLLTCFFLSSFFVEAQIPCSVTIVDYPITSPCCYDSLVAVVTDSSICGPWWYQWIPSTMIDNNPYLIVTSTTFVQVIVTNNGSGGCCGSMSDTITAYVVAGIENNSSNNFYINLSPNPTTKQITITFSKATRCNMQLTNTLGEMLEQTQINSSSHTLDMSNRAKGIYFVSVSDGKGNKTVRKIVKM